MYQYIKVALYIFYYSFMIYELHFERILFDYMDHDNCQLTFSKARLNIIGGKGALSNNNHYYYYYYYYY